MVGTASISYFKRYKMEVDLAALPPPQVPAAFRCLPWSHDLIEAHATVLYGSFKDEIDAHVFPSLGDPEGCCGLMHEICRRRSFIPEATWLLSGPAGPCGTIQALRERGVVGAIQNVGVLPPWRGRGLGRGQLEVTAQNEGAVRLYKALGFRRSRVLYKAVASAVPAL